MARRKPSWRDIPIRVEDEQPRELVVIKRDGSRAVMFPLDPDDDHDSHGAEAAG